MFIFAANADVCPPDDGRWSGTFFPRVEFQMAVDGRRFRLAQPLDAALAKPRADHAYRFALTGAGKRVRYRIKDASARDNHGRLRIDVSPATASDCAGGRHAAFGLATQEDCVARVARPN
jgi:hypothetical protein